MAPLPILVLCTVVLGLLLLSQEHCVEGSFTSREDSRTLSTSASSKQEEDPTPKQMATAKEDLLLAISSFPPKYRIRKRWQRRKEILNMVHDLERLCPTRDEQVLQQLQGDWEFLWEAKDKDPNSNPNVIQKPLEKYSSPSCGPPFVKHVIRKIADFLFGVGYDGFIFRFFVDSKRQRLQIVRGRHITMSFRLNFRPDGQDLRKIYCEQEPYYIFELAGAGVIAKLGLWFEFSGWLRTVFVDDTIWIFRDCDSLSVLQRFKDGPPYTAPVHLATRKTRWMYRMKSWWDII
eukprot:scaffold21629_cov102-Cylindrotheca_fusiformis.AAC.1